MNIFASLDPSVKKLLGWKLGDEEEKWALKAVESLVKKLRKRRSGGGGVGPASATAGCGTVEDLEYALAHPGSHSKCVTIPRSLDGRLQVSHRKGLPHVIYCRVWRWPNLQSHHELRPTPNCIYPYDSRSEFICINPYHYQRVESSPTAPPTVQPLRASNGSSHMPLQPTSVDPAGYYGSTPTQQTSQLVNGSLMGFPPCSSSSSSFPVPCYTASNQQQQQQFINLNGYNQQQQLYSYQQQQLHTQQQMLTHQHISQFGHNGGSPVGLPAGFINGQTPSSVSSACSTSSASSVMSAQSPSALSDDDEFIAAAAMAAAQSALNAVDQNAFAVCEGKADGQEHERFPDYWCSVCYYELNSRVGEPFKISSGKVIVDGFTDPSNDEKRICLGLLSNVNRNNTIECTRRHIGRGIRLTCTESGVTVHNLSASPVFVQSRNSNFKYNLQSTAVCRVPTNASIVIFDFSLFLTMLEKARKEGYHNVYDLQKMCFIRMSFVKGWGVDYHRQDVTSTPCWIEIQLHRPLAWIDNVLTPMNPPDVDITSVS